MTTSKIPHFIGEKAIWIKMDSKRTETDQAWPVSFFYLCIIKMWKPSDGGVYNKKEKFSSQCCNFQKKVLSLQRRPVMGDKHLGERWSFYPPENLQIRSIRVKSLIAASPVVAYIPLSLRHVVWFYLLSDMTKEQTINKQILDMYNDSAYQGLKAYYEKTTVFNVLGVDRWLFPYYANDRQL